MKELNINDFDIDNIICKKEFFDERYFNRKKIKLLTKDKNYKIIINPNRLMYIFCDDERYFYLDLKSINEHFYSKQEIRNIKLQKIYFYQFASSIEKYYTY